MNLKINDEVKSILRLKGIQIKEGIPFLVSTYFGYMPDYIPEDLKRKVYSCNIFTLDYTSNPPKIEWKVPLFEGQVVDNFDWIKDYMDMFKAINPQRRGSRSYALKRMKELFTLHPEIRKEDVMLATREYLSEITDPQYVMLSHKFISNEQGTPLLDRIKERGFTSSNKPTINPFKKII